MPRNDADPVLWEEMVVVGRVARAHGNKGAVIVNVETDFPERRFRVGNVLCLDDRGQLRSLRIVAARFHQGRPVLMFDGVETMGQAEALAGAEFRVPETELAPLPPGTFYRHELTGCIVEGVDGEVIGTVSGVEGAAGAYRLSVQRLGESDDQPADIEVPLAEPICVRVDPEQRVIVVDPPKGLLELNRRR
jgi:16S rRNA processing protein RimM